MNDKINACDVCGSVGPLPFRCKRCGGLFCGNHRLPEMHNCKSRQIENYIITGDKTDNIHYAPTSNDYLKNRLPNNFKTNSTDTNVKRKRKPRLINKLRRQSHFLRKILNNSISMLSVIIVLAILGVGYYVYIYDPNTVILNVVNSTDYHMKIHNNPNAHNPTYQELYNFIIKDNTDKIPYNLNSFVCIDYAVMVHDNAENANMTSGVALFEFSNYPDGHACNVFNTSDRGLIFIDCTGDLTKSGIPHHDKILLNPTIGDFYKLQPLTDAGGYYYSQEWKISEYHIIW
jgi:hypothetical protein